MEENMASSDESVLSMESLLVDVLRMKPDLEKDLALRLDRETWVKPNWKHLSRELNVDKKFISGLEVYTKPSPTIRLFEYLKQSHAYSVTIWRLKDALRNIARDDLYWLLIEKGYLDDEMVDREITSRRIDASSTRFGTLDELACALDGENNPGHRAGWINLGTELLELLSLKRFYAMAHYSPFPDRKSTINLFEYLSVTYPQMAVKSLRKALEVIKRSDVLEIIQDQKLEDEVLIKDLVTHQAEIIRRIADALSSGISLWKTRSGWRNLARHLNIQSSVCDEIDEHSKLRGPSKSPTKEVLQWLAYMFPEMTLTDFVVGLEKTECKDAIQIITAHFPDTVEIPVEIKLRGRLALEAYKKALDDGKASIKRVPIMLIGQDRSGKTSLKNSLMGKPFNPAEDSTIGIDADPSHIKVSTEIWKAGDNTSAIKAISFEQHAARLVADDLKEEHSGFAVEKIKMEDSGSSAVSVSNDSNQLPSEELGDPEVIPKISSDPTLKKEVHVPIESPGIPDEVAALIKKLLKEDENAQDDEEIYTILWDFGGQSVYYTTHPLFITARAIYLLVFDLSRDPYEIARPVVKQGLYKKILDTYGTKINLDYLNFWMTSVASLAAETEEQYVRLDRIQVKVPPVFLVCTHADEANRGADPFALAREVFGSLQTKRFRNHIYEDVFVVDNTKSAGLGSECSEVTRLREELLAVAKELPQMKEAIPIKWLKYERALQGTVRDGHKWISFSVAKEIAFEVCKIDDDQEFLTLLNFLHDQRILVHFDDTPALSNFVVLDPQWLVDVFKTVITVKPYDQEESKFKELWLQLESTGILGEKLLEHVWGPLLSQEETSASLLAIMERFSLLCPWPCSNASSGKQYLVPSMLMSHPPKEIMKLVASAQIPSLFIRFQSGQVPPGFFPRLVLQFFQWGQDEFWSAENPQLYADFARFYTFADDDCSVILLCHSSCIEVVVHRGNLSANPAECLQSKLNLSADINYGAFEVACARAVRRQLGLMLECMRKEFCWLKNMMYELGVICPVCCQECKVNYCCTHHKQCCEQEECLHFWSESDLRSAHQFIRCRRCAAAQSDKVYVKQFAPWFDPLDEQIPTDESEERRPASGGGIDEKVIALPSKAIETIMSQPCDSREVVLQLRDSLQLNQDSLEQPDPGTKRLIRCLANKAKQSNRLDVVKHLRDIAPAGTTGPLLPEHLDIGNIPVRQMTDLTLELSGGEEWKLVAEELGLSPREIRYIDKRVMNPCEAVLAYISRQCSISVGELYDRLNKCGLPVTADLL